MLLKIIRTEENDIATYGKFELYNSHLLVLSGVTLEPPGPDRTEKMLLHIPRRIKAMEYNGAFKPFEHFLHYNKVYNMLPYLYYNEYQITIHFGINYRDTIACILVGEDFTTNTEYPCLTNSKTIFKNLCEKLKFKDFTCIIENRS